MRFSSSRALIVLSSRSVSAQIERRSACRFGTDHATLSSIRLEVEVYRGQRRLQVVRYRRQERRLHLVGIAQRLGLVSRWASWNRWKARAPSSRKASSRLAGTAEATGPGWSRRSTASTTPAVSNGCSVVGPVRDTGMRACLPAYIASARSRSSSVGSREPRRRLRRKPPGTFRLRQTATPVNPKVAAT